MCFFFNDTATTEIYTLSLHDALPIWSPGAALGAAQGRRSPLLPGTRPHPAAALERPDARSARTLPCSLLFRTSGDRKSTRLNSSHANISYAVFCLKKKNKQRVSTLLS